MALSLDSPRVLKMTNIEQFAVKVVNFSSQYGTAGTSSYTASNLAASLNVYPKYGDYTEAFVLVSCLRSNLISHHRVISLNVLRVIMSINI